MSTGIAKDCLHGENVIVIVATNNGGADRSSSISITLEETILTVAFLDNIGQVSIEITDDNGVTMDFTTFETPNGYMYFISIPGRYTITITLSNGDKYYGNFIVYE